MITSETILQQNRYRTVSYVLQKWDIIQNFKPFYLNEMGDFEW